jgi:hypothetical protein
MRFFYFLIERVLTKKILSSIFIFLFVAFSTEQSNAQVSFSANVNCPVWAGENVFQIRTGTTNQSIHVASICWSANCYNGADGVFAANVTLGNSAYLCDGLGQDSYGDAWNSSESVSIKANGVSIGTYIVLGSSQIHFFTLQVGIPAFELAQETNPTFFTAAPACNNASIRMGGGVWRDEAIVQNTWYNWITPATFLANGNQFRIRPTKTFKINAVRFFYRLIYFLTQF